MDVSASPPRDSPASSAIAMPASNRIFFAECIESPLHTSNWPAMKRRASSVTGLPSSCSRGTGLHHPATVQQHHISRQARGLAQIVRGHHHLHAATH